MIDDVTGLPSQPLVFDRLEEELHRGRRYGRPLSVLMLDVDGLKQVNQETHRLFGSFVLREIGELFLRTFRRCDTVYRFESDQFVVILPETRTEHAWIAAERVRRTVGEREFSSPPWSVHMTISAGVGGSTGGKDETARDLIRSLDQAVDRAKRQGRNRCELAAPLAAP